MPPRGLPPGRSRGSTRGRSKRTRSSASSSDSDFKGPSTKASKQSGSSRRPSRLQQKKSPSPPAQPSETESSPETSTSRSRNVDPNDDLPLPQDVSSGERAVVNNTTSGGENDSLSTEESNPAAQPAAKGGKDFTTRYLQSVIFPKAPSGAKKKSSGSPLTTRIDHADVGSSSKNPPSTGTPGGSGGTAGVVGSTGTPGIPGGTVSNRRATDISTLGSSQVADDEDEEDEAVSQPRGRNSQPAEDTLVLASNDDEDDDEITLVPADQEPAKISKPTKFYPPNPDWKGIAAAIEDNGYSELLDATLQYALDSGHKEARSIATYEAEDESHRYWWFSNALPSLACVRRDALNLLIAGNFARAIHEHEEMRNDRDTPSDVRRQYDLHEYVAAYKHRSARQPSIYQLSLVDQDGYSPTMTEIQALIKELRSYEGMHQRFRERHRAIDRMYDPRLSKVKDPDYRKYIHESERPSQRCRIMRAFSDELEKRWISAIKAGVDDTDKFPHTLTYVGYALNAVIREKQHLQTGSPGTNWLSSLCVSILNYLFKGRDDVREPFRMELHVISFIGSEPGASMAEMLFGIITSSYYWTGLGFNVAFCGNSVLSIELKGKSDSEKRKLREDWAAYLVDSTPMPDNLKWSAKARERLVEKEAGRCRELLRNLNFADNPGMRVRLESLLQSYEEDEGDVAISTKRRRA